jgi:carbon storage regulator
MLVLSRKIGQRILIGPNIYVKVIEIRGNRVKLGFEGPDDVPIHREEVAVQMAAESLFNECAVVG